VSDLRAFRSIGFNHPHGNLNAARSKTPCCILLSTRDRDVFVTTVFSAFQRLDSVPLEIGARTVSLVCQEMFTTREECLRRNPRIQSVPVFFSAITPGSTSAKRQSGLSANSASRKLEARLCVSAQSLVRSGRNVISRTANLALLASISQWILRPPRGLALRSPRTSLS